MAVVRNLLVRGGADFSGMRREMMRAQKSMNEFKSGMTGAMKGIAAALAGLGIGIVIKDAVKSAMDVEAAMQQINRTMGTSAKAFADWANHSALAFNMSKSDAIRYGAVYSNLISGFNKDTKMTMKYTEDLLKASAIVASGTGRTMEDVMERIRSGMLGNTESIEDLGINVNIAMIQSTNAFKKFANGKSWQQLDFQTQQQIRLFAILEQSTTKYGDAVANNTNSKMQQFTAQLRNVQLSLGQAFLPILNIILPALTSLVSGLARAMSVFAQFTQALFGKSDNQTKATNKQAGAVTGLGDAYKAAGAAAKGAVSGFDEVNTLSDPASGSGATDPTAGLGAAAGTSPMEGIGSATEEVSAKVKEMADKVKASFGEMTDFIVTHKDLIIAALSALGTAFAGVWLALNWSKIAAGVTTAVEAIIAIFAALTIEVWLIIAAVAAIVGAFVYFYRTNETFRGVVDGILRAIGDAAVWLWQSVLVPLGQFIATIFVAAWNGLVVVVSWLWNNVLVPLGNFLMWLWNNVLVPLGLVLTDILGVAFQIVSDIALSFWQNVLVPLGEFFATVFGPTVEALSAIFNFFWKYVLVPFATFIGTVLKVVFTALIAVIEYLWNNVLKPLVVYVGGILLTVFTNVFKAIGGVIDGLALALKGVMNFITGVFTGNWQKAWDGVKDIFAGVFNSLYSIVKTPLNMIIDMVNLLISGLNSIKFSLPSWIPGVGGKSFGISIPSIPRLARGGIVDGATNMGNYVAGESGSEMIVPLENTSFVDKLAGALGTAVLTAMRFNNGGSNQSKDAVFQIDGVTIARLLSPYLDLETNRVGGSMIVTT